MDVLEKSLKRAFIDRDLEGSTYDPKLIINKPEKNEYFLNVLQDELDSCQEFFFSIAFVTQSGLNGLKTHLSDLAKKGIKGRLLTSTYLHFNQPEMFESLLEIPNLEIRISEKEGFHAKGYLFSQPDYQSFIIGSSNLTMNALKINYEWNIRLTSYEHGELIHQIREDMKTEWMTSIPLTVEWVESYRKLYNPQIRSSNNSKIIEENPYNDYILPNAMQKSALKKIEGLRQSGAKKGLIISATGTGKTYLAAFDVLKSQPQKMLFIVHREQILNHAKNSFRKVIGGKDSDFGVLSGSKKELDAKYLFATIQTISKPEYQELFERDYFKYILIDEVHKAGAKSYLRTLEYFKPDFLLGMTATPERTDAFNIFELFDYNIAYEIRLQEALEEDLLCPFHYFGVTDYEVRDEIISETTDLQFLVSTERVQFLLEKIKYYGCSYNNPKGLVFCSRKEEASDLSKLFNEEGIPSSYLVGDHSIEEREKEVERLENGEIHYIFTVDIFNEGIDIPKINQVIMLRNTESSIIFVQQLGRGLRKDPSKEFVTVIDFIGNYKNNYMIPMALSGDVSRNKNNLRQKTFETNYITGVSSINFETIAKERIFKSIDSSKMDSKSEFRNIYFSLKNRINRVPFLKDFQEQGVLDPLILFEGSKKFNHYHEFLVSTRESSKQLSTEKSQLLKFFCKELIQGYRKHELILTYQIIQGKVEFTYKDLQILFKIYSLPNDARTIQSVVDTLSLDYYVGQQKTSYLGASFVRMTDKSILVSDNLLQSLKDPYFVKLLNDCLSVALEESKKYQNDQPFTLYKKYRRRDTIRLLNWDEQIIDQSIGGYTYRDGKFVIFVTLHKEDDFKGALMAYEDKLIDESTLHYFTKSPRTISSPEVKILQNPDDWEIYVFAKKSNDEGIDFYYMGEVVPDQKSIIQVEKPVKDGKKQSVVQMDLKFKKPIDSKLFTYLSKVVD